MSLAYLLTGKFGDLLNIAPVLHDKFRKTGQPQSLVVAKEYASILDGLDYIKPVIFDGPWTDFRGAYQFAKQQFDVVISPQMSGLKSFDHRTPSTMLDAWDRMGCLEQWDTLPLVIHRTAATTDKNKTIFYADHSQSSPFFHKEQMHKLLVENFPTHQVIRASGMRLKTLRDFLPYMDRADLIVAVETSFLHLSAACETPVIAMVTNLPSHWHGTPWSRRFALHCRYNDFERRKVEIIAAANRAIGGHKMPEPETFKTQRPHGYNMSIGDGAFVYRYHPDKSWKTKLVYEDGKGFVTDILFPKECDDFSTEDGRCFSWNGQPWLSYTCSREEGGRWYSAQAYGRLVHSGDRVSVEGHTMPKFGRNNFGGMEKNWVFFEA